MENRMVIFGATGATGQELIKQSLQKKYRVTAFVRNPEKLNISDKNLKIVQGNILNYSNVLDAIGSQDVVLCALGASPKDKSKLRTKGTANIIKAMKEKGAKRLLCVSALGVGDSKSILPWYYTKLIIPLALKNVYKDHETQEVEIAKSSLGWTIIRPAVLTNDQQTGSYQHGFHTAGKLKMKISRADVAHFMIDLINSNQYLQKKVCVSN